MPHSVFKFLKGQCLLRDKRKSTVFRLHLRVVILIYE